MPNYSVLNRAAHVFILRSWNLAEEPKPHRESREKKQRPRSIRPAYVGPPGRIDMQSCGPSPFRSHTRRSWLEAAATARSESRLTTPTTSTSPHRSGKRGRISIEDMKRNTDYPWFRERADFVRAEAKRAGRRSCPKQGRRYRSPAISNLAPALESSPPSAPTNTIPACKDFISTPSSNSHLRNQLNL